MIQRNIQMGLALLLTILLLSGCGAVLVGSAATGISALHDRRTVGTIVDDRSIEFRLAELLREDGYNQENRIKIYSYNNQVLLLGQVNSHDTKQAVAKLARNTDKVKSVYNELVVNPQIGLGTITTDSLITARIKAKMLVTENLDPLRIKVVTENGVVYMMGLVNTTEASLATELAQNTSGVKKITRLFEYGDYALPAHHISGDPSRLTDEDLG